MKRLIFAILIVIAAIAGLIYGFMYINNSSAQEAILKEELEKVAQIDITEEDIDMNIKTIGKYAVVEETMKNYLNEARSIYKNVENYCNTNSVSTIISVKNIEQDDKKLSSVKLALKDYKENLNKEVKKFEELLYEQNIMGAIREKNLKDYYNDIYKSVMLNETIQDNLDYASGKLKKAKEKSLDKLENVDDVIEFLEKNTKSWEIKDGKIQFTNIQKLTEYYDLLNEAM